LEPFEISFGGAFARRGVLESPDSSLKRNPTQCEAEVFLSFPHFHFRVAPSEFDVVRFHPPMVQDPIHPRDSTEGTPLRSEFHDDPDMRDIVRAFLEEIPKRLALMDALLETGNRVEFRRVVHQMKGAGGGYGFQEISNAAAQLERCMNLSGEQWCRDCLTHFSTFQTLLRRAHAGLPELQ